MYNKYDILCGQYLNDTITPRNSVRRVILLGKEPYFPAVIAVNFETSPQLLSWLQRYSETALTKVKHGSKESTCFLFPKRQLPSAGKLEPKSLNTSSSLAARSQDNFR